ncbi:IS66 family insertion sequence element accessory protein TnpB [Rhizobium ruizarguesonis]|uniref:IS66 family insertion sequence element accessory protein TnpB n=1 Tax=Rhizobium ruizarguesonis TaxID=2081791 RepID=UPI0013EE8179|nr:IS66 family insertion sequence element accessory protein TnpB [Rhizobium ruizarguesonis]
MWSRQSKRPVALRSSSVPLLSAWKKARLPPASPLSRVPARFRNDLSIKSRSDHGGDQAVDFRKGHDGLAALVKDELHKDPFTGTVFVFRSRKADRLKLINWDGSGLVMAYKRLEEHTFTWPGIRDGLMTLGHAQFEAT